MARKTSISDEEILEAARECFHEQGVSATTAAIARRAGVSEGSIFRRWETKTELFHAAMADRVPPWFELVDELEGSGDPRANLERLIKVMMADFENFIRKFSLMIAITPEKRRGKGTKSPSGSCGG